MVISASNVNGRGGTPKDMTIEQANLVLEWNARAGKLSFDLYDATVEPSTPPEGYQWEFKNQWTIQRSNDATETQG